MALSAEYFYITILAVLLLTSVSETHGKAKVKRQLPVSTLCDPRQQESCYKGDLISEGIADCKKTSLLKTCKPINNRLFSSVVDLPNTSNNGVDCVGDTSRPMVCGSPGSNTRCVCDKAVDWKRKLFNQCRCQYWPTVDVRKNRPSYCTQYDNGGKSGVHFYTCCNNCNDVDSSCRGRDYQGGGSKGDYCDACGLHTSDGGGRATYSFNCVSCDQQRACELKCNGKFNGLFAKIPGFCPKWSRCFRECCIEADNNEQRLKAELQKYKLY